MCKIGKVNQYMECIAAGDMHDGDHPDLTIDAHDAMHPPILEPFEVAHSVTFVKTKEALEIKGRSVRQLHAQTRADRTRSPAPHVAGGRQKAGFERRVETADG